MTTKEAILQYLDQHGELETLTYAAQIGEDHQKVVGIIKSLHSFDQLINSDQVTSKCWKLTDEGRQVAETGSHEVRVFNAVPATGIPLAELMSSVPNARLGFNNALTCGWLVLDKAGGGGREADCVRRKVQTVTDVVQHHLLALQNNPAAEVSDKLKLEYKKRKLLQQQTVKSYKVTRGSAFSVTAEKADADLTADMIASGDWRNRNFKAYNFDALGTPLARGHLHPLLKVRAEFRQIFLEMGFSEMPTNRFVESSFWNFDALFQPQQHPARDAQDTFFLTEPATSCRFPADYMQRVGERHTRGYGSQWKVHEAQKNILRTHTTAVSAHMLYRLAQQKEFKPVRYFSIDRVFRNETLDATHLAEFHQIEGVVADRGLSLGDLMGVIQEFFNKLGIERIRFKPAYNPYTEPSMEIFSWHPGLSKWVEVGNSGMFRPEMLLPMGLPPDVNVIAWGLSLERPTMIMYGYDNIRDLCGHRINLQMVANSPICRLEKAEKRNDSCTGQGSALERLELRQQALLEDIAGMTPLLEQAKQQQQRSPLAAGDRVTEQFSAVLHMDPSAVPHSVLSLLYFVRKVSPDSLSLQVHTHSSCSTVETPQLVPAGDRNSSRSAPLHVTVIWRLVSSATLLVDGSAGPVVGEAAVLRVLTRGLGLWTRLHEDAVRVDAWMDRAELAAAEVQAEDGQGDGEAIRVLAKGVTEQLQTGSWLLPKASPSLADLYVCSVLQAACGSGDDKCVQRWRHRLSETTGYRPHEASAHTSSV